MAKAVFDVPICEGKKGGCAFFTGKLCFLVWLIACFYLLRGFCLWCMFVFETEQDLWETSKRECDRHVLCEGFFWCVFFEGSAVFTFWEISCDSACWWNLISLLVKKKLNATSSRPTLPSDACVPRFSCVQCIWVLWSGFTLVCKCCTFLYLVLFLVYEPCAINLCELSTYTNPIFCFLLRATSFLL